MKIEDGTVVTLHYALYDADSDELIEQSHGSEPMAYLHGHNNIIKGLEQALAGHEAGDSLDVTVRPAEGYGERDESLTQRISRKYLKHAGKLEPGKIITVNTDDGPRHVRVIKTGLKTVDIDANHPFAGRTLRFAVTIDNVREASAEEKDHGHAHGPGGHQH